MLVFSQASSSGEKGDTLMQLKPPGMLRIQAHEGPAGSSGLTRQRTLTFVEGPDSPDPRARQALNDLLRRSPLGLCIIDMLSSEQQIIFVNQVFVDWSGYSEEAVFGQTLDFLLGEGTDAVVARNVHEAIASGEEFRGMVRTRRRAGVINNNNGTTELYNTMLLSPVWGRSGKVSHYAVIQDFSLLPPVTTPGEPSFVRQPSARRESRSTINTLLKWMPFRRRKYAVEPSNLGRSSLGLDSLRGDAPSNDAGQSALEVQRSAQSLTTSTASRRARRVGGVCNVAPDHDVWSELVISSLGPKSIPYLIHLANQDEGPTTTNHAVPMPNSPRRQSVC
eukprot:jgi/Chlat1/3202/Chrsp22S03484